ncbi:MAG: TonB-dependent receptor [Gammaproteobacteria bacterium]|nr:TonB-dependent receptor [Gammaproteobacteria bacterium]
MGELKDLFVRVGLVLCLVFSSVAIPAAMAAEGAQVIEEVVVTGSRRAARSATDAAVPVDVFTGDEIGRQGSHDMDDLLRNLIPSYNVKRSPISDAATITRPANLRGLPSSDTLIMVNGKRRHRSGVISEFGGSHSDGAQGPDVSVILPIGLKQVEVLRDGASAQYGSDAIAGVINFILKDNNSGMDFEIKTGETFEDDGEIFQIAGNIGLPLGDNGFISISAQFKEADPTSRSTQRVDAQALIDTGNTAVLNPAQVWGSPEVNDDWSMFVNSGIELSDTQEIYAFGNYAERKVDGGFFFRNPNARPGTFTTSFSGGQRAIMDLTILDSDPAVRGTGGCPVLMSPGSTPTDQAAVDADAAAMAALDPNVCWLFNNRHPGGYTPAFGGDVEDISAVIGVRGTMENGLSYDFSLGLGRNDVAFRISNTINASMGPASPDEFDLGHYVQTEQNYNADFSYPVAVDAFYSDLNIAFGLEYRVETFETQQGEEASWVAGPFAFQPLEDPNLVGMAVGAHGFAGFGPSQVGKHDRANWAVYVDFEADITEEFLLDVAFRAEDYDDFGSTFNSKVAGRYRVNDRINLRASASTGFRAPTPGQATVTKLTTATLAGTNELIQLGTIPPTNPVAAFFGGKALEPEESVGWTVGMSWDITDDLTATVDYYRIDLEDRIALGGQQNIGPVEAAALEAAGIPGASDLAAITFYTNEFESETQGVDLVATYVLEWGGGLTNFQAAWNWTETDITKFTLGPVSRNTVTNLENLNPENRWILSANHAVGDWTFLVRASYYDEWVSAGAGNSAPTNSPLCDSGLPGPDRRDECYDDNWLVDVEASYTFNDTYTVTLGAHNVFDEFPQKDFDLPQGSGNTYNTASPYGFDGGLWYLRLSASFE